MNNLNKKIVGFWLYMLTDCIMFSILFLSFLTSKNFYLKKKIFNYRIIIIETLILLYCSYISILIIKKKNNIFFFIIIILLNIFLTIEYKDLLHLCKINLSYSYNNYLSNYYAILTFHAFHIIISIVINLNFLFLNKKKHLKTINVIILSIFLHFLHIIWLIITYILIFK